jgi:hypothetical protein
MYSFYDGLSDQQKTFFDLYKSNGPFMVSGAFATTLNTYLQENSLPAEWQPAVAILDEVILINKLTEERVVYRATSLEIINANRTGDQISYPAFLSTGADKECVKTHFRNVETWYTPALLTIHCEPGTAIAPFENSQTSGTEKELLLGRDLIFSIEKEEQTTDRNTMNDLMDRDFAIDFEQLYLITLRVHGN